MSARRRAWRLRWGLVLTGAAVVLVALVGLAGYRALQARTALAAVAADFQQISEGVRSGDGTAVRSALASARREARRADAATGGATWWIASHSPLVGNDAQAVHTVAEVSRSLTGGAVADLLDEAEALDPEQFRPHDGSLDVSALQKVAPDVVAAARELAQQDARVQAIDAGSLAFVSTPVRAMQDKLSEASTLASRASYAARLLPPMLGESGPRTYMVIFQNNAEIRASGGIPGAFAILSAHHGKVSILRQGTAADLGFHERSPIRLTNQETALFEPKLGMYGQDTNFTPDFPRTAEILRAMWRSDQGQELDGVLSADPVALSYVLEGTGPVEVPGGPVLTASNAVDVLLRDVYRTQPDPELQNAFFARSARAVFDALAAGRGNAVAELRGLTRSAEEGRLYAWSAHPDEQRLLAGTSLGGVVPREAGPSPYVGVFVNDGTGAKMQYYLEHRVDVQPLSCGSEGRQRLAVTVTLHSNAPADARTLPESVIGDRGGNQSFFGVRPGHMRMNVYVYAPLGGRFDGSSVDGQKSPLAELEHDGHPVAVRTVDLAPGDTRRLAFTVTSGPHQTGDVALRVTPGVRPMEAGTAGPSACGR